MNDLIQRLREYAEDDCEVSTQKEFINSAADALEKQQAEIERLKGHIKHIGNDALRAELRELKAQAAKDAADAGRYRYWRDKHGWSGYFDDGATNSDDNKDIDAAIDSAMKESQA